MRTKFFTVLCLLTAAIFIGMQPTYGQTCVSNDATVPVGIVPTLETFPGGSVQCGDQSGYRFNDPTGTQTFNDGYGNSISLTVSSTPCGPVFSWTVSGSIVVDVIRVKGGANQQFNVNVYDYSGTPTTDGNLHSPVNPSNPNGFYYGLSHIDFCFHYKLTIGKTAFPKFTRRFNWTINKSCNGSAELILSEGQTFNYPFSWTADVSGFTDSDWKVDGTITIANNTPISAIITSVADQLSDGTVATVVCNGSFTLAPGATLECTYSAVDVPDADPGTNTVTVVTSTPLVEGGTATATYAFVNPTTKVDECITVTDDCTVGPTNVCQDAAPVTLNYTCPIGPYEVCGDYTYTNSASFTPTGGTKVTSSCDVAIHIPCLEGCTLTPGYWKTHSSFGPAPYDNNWANLLPSGEISPFFFSGQTYYEVLWTSPSGGNAYYILAHAYIAAKLNFLNGADASAAQTAFDQATALFNAPVNTPAFVGGLKGAKRQAWINLATTLDNYNNGLIGPGHCDEEPNGTAPSSSSGAVNEPMNPMKVEKPAGFTLEQNYPNPFNPVTQIRFAVEKPGQAKLVVFNTLGEVVVTLFDASAEAGRYYQVEFDASQLSSGIYFYRLSSGDQVQIKKLLLVR